MTEVHFYHNVRDSRRAACQLVSRAYQRGRQVALLAADHEAAAGLDAALWDFDPQSFIPHVMLDSPHAAETPVQIGSTGHSQCWPHGDILLNFGSAFPEKYSAFTMVIEVVGRSEEERQAARARWMDYRRQGIQPVGHDMGNEHA